MNDKKVCVIGGDLRQIYAAHEMYKNNIDISVFGLECSPSDFVESSSLNEAIENADTILLPLPFSTDGIRICCPLSEKDIKLDDLLKKLKKDQQIVGGKFNKKFTQKAKEQGINLYDYYSSERLTTLNALTTAEAAVSLAMNEIRTTIHGTKCAVFGFGRIGKTLSKILHSLGSDVSVYARSSDALTWAEIYGYKAININETEQHISENKVIFNTIPKLVITDKILDKIDENSLIIDLASYPGGVDFSYAKQTQKKVIFALSLPGKYAPETSGKIIADTVLSYLRGDSI